MLGFNPCCSGRCSRSLPPTVREQREGRSFNPCCGGRCSRRHIQRDSPVNPSVFQSLLWWKMLSKVGIFKPELLPQLVSILVVVEDALELFWTLLPFEVQLLPIGNPTPGGQSLLWWKMLSKTGCSKVCNHLNLPNQFSQRDPFGAILVVVEDALEGCSLSVCQGVSVGFNPCCNGRCSRSVRRRRAWPSLSGFNPCCGGRCSRSSTQSRYLHIIPVSILVVVEDALELFWILLPFEVQLLPIGNPTPGGQSLLWWKMLSKDGCSKVCNHLNL